jgi:hypothetical protein
MNQPVNSFNIFLGINSRKPWIKNNNFLSPSVEKIDP